MSAFVTLEGVASMRSGEHTPASLLAACLEGADEDRIAGWHEYVAAVVLAAGVQS